MGKQTPLYQQHQTSGAKIVDFAGWDMPLHYGSQLEEHHHVRKDAGMFDVSHMTIIDVSGSQAKEYLQFLLANDVAKLTLPGKALYSCMLNEKGGVIDDLIVYYLGPNDYRVVVNSSTREKDLAWLEKHTNQFDVILNPRPDLAIIAIQGPNARSKVAKVLSSNKQAKANELKIFQAAIVDNWLIARTGYTGEDGYEIMLPAEDAVKFWQDLQSVGVAPCGLGARDTLRLEAGMSLYGNDLDEEHTPLESNLAWTIALEPIDRDFIGRSALEHQQSRLKHILVGLVLEEKGVLRNHQKIIIPNLGEGEITSGTFSPTLNHGIALARIPAGATSECFVDIRGKQTKVRIVKPPFVRNGQKVFS